MIARAPPSASARAQPAAHDFTPTTPPRAPPPRQVRSAGASSRAPRGTGGGRLGGIFGGSLQRRSSGADPASAPSGRAHSMRLRSRVGGRGAQAQSAGGQGAGTEGAGGRGAGDPGAGAPVAAEGSKEELRAGEEVFYRHRVFTHGDRLGHHVTKVIRIIVSEKRGSKVVLKDGYNIRLSACSTSSTTLMCGRSRGENARPRSMMWRSASME